MLSLQAYQSDVQIVRNTLCGSIIIIGYIFQQYPPAQINMSDFVNPKKVSIFHNESVRLQIKEEDRSRTQFNQTIDNPNCALLIIDMSNIAVKFANQFAYNLAEVASVSVDQLLDYIIVIKVDKQANIALGQQIKNISLKKLIVLIDQSKQVMTVSILECSQNLFKNYSIRVSNINEMVVQFDEVKERDRYLKRHYQFEIMKQLFTTFSHEFGTSLNYMLALAQTAIENFPEQTEYFEPIRCTGQILHNFVMGMVDFNDIQAKSFSLQLEQVDVNQVMYDIVQLFAHQVTKKGLTIEFEQFLSKGPLISDSRRIKEVLVNLVSNSQKFTYTGGIILSVQSIINDHYQFCVKDTGIGMYEDEACKLRETLKTDLKLQDQISQNTAGFGLGCFISNKITKKLSKLNYVDGGGLQFKVNQKGMQFSFIVESQLQAQKILCSVSSSSGIQKLNKNSFIDMRQSALNMSCRQSGTKYKKHVSLIPAPIYSPSIVRIRQASEQANSIGRINEESISSGGAQQDVEQGFEKSIQSAFKKGEILQCQTRRLSCMNEQRIACSCAPILIVDDEMINIMGLQLMLRQFNLLADSAFNGADALVKIQANQLSHCQYSLVFMDINMPIMNGIDSTIEIMAKITKPPEIVACTAYNDADTRESCYKAGMSHFLNKPINKQALAKILLHSQLITSC